MSSATRKIEDAETAIDQMLWAIQSDVLSLNHLFALHPDKIMQCESDINDISAVINRLKIKIEIAKQNKRAAQCS